MNDILVATGTCGVGKSAICWAWANRRKGAVIECDAFRTWIRNPSLRRSDAYQEKLLAKHASALAIDYLAMGLDVAIDNVWSPAGLGWLEEHLDHIGRMRVFWLNCSPAENHRRDSSRPYSNVMGMRLDELQVELEGMSWPSTVVKLDTSGQSLDQTLEMIENIFGARNTGTSG